MEARHKMMNYEYAVCLATFFCIQIVGIQLGMLFGVLISLIIFAYVYSSMASVSSATLRSSTVVRSYKERATLIANRGKIVTIALNGYIFFGSAVRVLEDITSKIELRVVEDDPAMDGEQPALSSSTTEDSIFDATFSPVELVCKSAPKVQPDRPLSDMNSFFNAFNSPSDDPRSAAKTPVQRAPSARKDKLMSASKSSIVPRIEEMGLVNENTRLLGRSGQKAKPLMEDYDSLATPAGKHVPPPFLRQRSRSQSAQQNHHALFDDGHGKHVELALAMGGNHSHHPLEGLKTVYEMSGTEIQHHYEVHQQIVHSADSPPRPTRLLSGSHDNSKFPPRKANFNDDEQSRLCRSYPTPNATCHIDSLALTSPQIIEPLFTPPSGASNNHSSILLPFSSPPPKINNDLDLLATVAVQPAPTTVKPKKSFRRVNEIADMHVSTDSDDIHKPTAIQHNVDIATPRCGSWVVGEDLIPREEAHIHKEAVDILTVDSGKIDSRAFIKHDATSGSDKFDTSCGSMSASSSTSMVSLTPVPVSNGHQGHSGASGNGRPPQASRSHWHPPVASSPPPMYGISYHSPRDKMEKTNTRPSTPLLYAKGNAEITSAPLDEEMGIPQESNCHAVTEYLVLDFSTVLGVDATAARTCFRSLVNLTKEAAATVVFAQMPTEVETLLRAHHVITAHSVVFSQVDDALEWCENQLLSRGEDPQGYAQIHNHRQQALHTAERGISPLPIADAEVTFLNAFKLRTILEDYLDLPISNQAVIARILHADLLAHYFKREHFGTHELIFEVGDLAEKLYFIERGEVEIITIGSALADLAIPSSNSSSSRHTSNHSTRPNAGSIFCHDTAIRVSKVCKGCAFGEAEFFLHHTYR